MNLIERAKSILLQPKETWATIDTESTDVATLFTRYAMVLAAIPAVCGFIGMSLIGFGGFGVTIRTPFVAGLVNMVVSYVLSLVGVFVLGLIIDALAPTFGGQKSPIQALKVAVPELIEHLHLDLELLAARIAAAGDPAAEVEQMLH